MVVFLDLDDETLEPEEDPRHGPFSSTRLYPANHHGIGGEINAEIYSDGREITNARGFSAALACYPVVTQLARSLDLNTLHALSRTCRQFRANLLQCRRQLIARTLRCSSELEDGSEDENTTGTPRYRSYDVEGSFGIPPSRITHGKLGPCARDMVSDCRRCGRIVCRNCITKPRSAKALPNRLRRLCAVCVRAPLPELMDPHGVSKEGPTFTSKAFVREPCSCLDIVFICQPCGHATSTADLSYRRIWSYFTAPCHPDANRYSREWRTRYSTYLGGLGTGIGEGNEGVECGRGDKCLAAHVNELEIDCRSQELASFNWVSVDAGGRDGASVEEAIGEDGAKAGYLAQEIMGLGGVVRKKFKKIVRVGKAVEEFEDERETAGYMAREAKGERAWCGWCNRVVPSAPEKQAC